MPDSGGGKSWRMDSGPAKRRHPHKLAFLQSYDPLDPGSRAVRPG